MGLQPTVAEGDERSASGRNMAAWQTEGSTQTNHDGKQIRIPLIAIVLLGLLVHVLYFIHFHNVYSPDSSSYLTPAFNLVHGQGFTGPDDRPETVRTPGYPLLIAPFLAAGANPRAVVFFQHLMLVGLTAATVIVAFRLTGSRRLAIMVGILLVIDLPFLEAANRVLTEAFFTVVLAAALWLLWRGSKQPENWWRLLAAGLLAGVSVLIRPVTLYFFVPAALYLVLTRNRFSLRSALLFTAAFAIAPGLWAARNYQQTAHFTVSSISGRELLCWRAGGVLALDEPGDFNDNIAKRCPQLEKEACDALQRTHGADCSQVSPEEKAVEETRLARKILMQHPIGSLRLGLRGMAIMFLDGGPYSLQGIAGINPHLGVRLLMIYTAPALGCAVLGLARLWKRNRQLFYFCFLVMAYFVAVSAGGDTYSRHRVPIMPMYAILIASGLDSIFNLGKRHNLNHMSS